MINEPTTLTSVTNQTVTPTGVVNSTTLVTSVGGQQAVTSTVINNIEIDTTRTEGLWTKFVFLWQLDSPWSFESIVKSNTEVINV